MGEQLKKISQGLFALDKKAEELDRILQDVRVEINNALWDLIELKKENSKQK